MKGLENVPADIPETAEVVSLPHTWNAKDGQDGGNDYFRGSCCYVKKIEKNSKNLLTFQLLCGIL